MRACDIVYDTEYDMEVPVGCTEYSCEKGGECIVEEEQFKRSSFGEVFPPDEDVIKGSEEQDNGSSSVFDRDELLSEKKVDENIWDEKSVIQEQPLEPEATLNDRGIFISAFIVLPITKGILKNLNFSQKCCWWTAIAWCIVEDILTRE